jgi:16S rRNA C967 or C1407 C5-methylase (RsmB/RsmF family)
VLHLDDDFDDLLIIPSHHLSAIKSGLLVSNGYLIFQVFLVLIKDKASMYWAGELKSFIKKGHHIIDTRAGCGTKISQLSQIVGTTGKVFAFENRAARLESLKFNIKQYGCESIC